MIDSRYLKTSASCMIAILIVALTGCSGGTAPVLVPAIQPGDPVGSNLTQISSDPFSAGAGQHATEVEPHMIANGNTLVAAFQTGRIKPGGATDIGWATSIDGGTTWSHGFLPGLTTGEGSGPYEAASDPAVAYDAKHGVWMIASLPLSATLHSPAVVVSRSSDGLNWQDPVSVDTLALSSDKNWIVCDSWVSSPYFGNCYVEWDDPLNQGVIEMNTSRDGGARGRTPSQRRMRPQELEVSLWYNRTERWLCRQRRMSCRHLFRTMEVRPGLLQSRSRRYNFTRTPEEFAAVHSPPPRWMAREPCGSFGKIAGSVRCARPMIWCTAFRRME
jgi:hypothetical protein